MVELQPFQMLRYEHLLGEALCGHESPHKLHCTQLIGNCVVLNIILSVP